MHRRRLGRRSRRRFGRRGRRLGRVGALAVEQDLVVLHPRQQVLAVGHGDAVADQRTADAHGALLQPNVERLAVTGPLHVEDGAGDLHDVGSGRHLPARVRLRHEEGVRAAVRKHDPRPDRRHVADLRPRLRIERDLRPVGETNPRPDALGDGRADLARRADRPVDHLEGQRSGAAHREPGRRRRHQQQRREPDRRHRLPAQTDPTPIRPLQPPQPALVDRPVLPGRLVAQRPARQLDQPAQRLRPPAARPPTTNRLVVPRISTPRPRYRARTSATAHPVPDRCAPKPPVASRSAPAAAWWWPATCPAPPPPRAAPSPRRSGA